MAVSHETVAMAVIQSVVESTAPMIVPAPDGPSPAAAVRRPRTQVAPAAARAAAKRCAVSTAHPAPSSVPVCSAIRLAAAERGPLSWSASQLMAFLGSLRRRWCASALIAAPSAAHAAASMTASAVSTTRLVAAWAHPAGDQRRLHDEGGVQLDREQVERAGLRAAQDQLQGNGTAIDRVSKAGCGETRQAPLDHWRRFTGGAGGDQEVHDERALGRVTREAELLTAKARCEVLAVEQRANRRVLARDPERQPVDSEVDIARRAHRQADRAAAEPRGAGQAAGEQGA
jgi:hypothetical protein